MYNNIRFVKNHTKNNTTAAGDNKLYLLGSANEGSQSFIIFTQISMLNKTIKSTGTKKQFNAAAISLTAALLGFL